MPVIKMALVKGLDDMHALGGITCEFGEGKERNVLLM